MPTSSSGLAAVPKLAPATPAAIAPEIKFSDRVPALGGGSVLRSCVANDFGGLLPAEAVFRPRLRGRTLPARF
jgi:hypothetical protein